jgi:tRNA G46 methylase TrmB
MVRQHVNPLLLRYSTRPSNFQSWSTLFSNPNNPLTLDIGCAKGALLKALAIRRPNENFLGLEIREEPLLYAVKNSIGIPNLAYLSTNFELSASKWWAPITSSTVMSSTVLASSSVSASESSSSSSAAAAAAAAAAASLSSSVSSSMIESTFEATASCYPGDLKIISILMPDPQFKNRYKKRRTVTSNLIKVLSERQKSGGRLIFQTDVLSLFEDMKDVLSKEDIVYRIEPRIDSTSSFFDTIESEREALVKKQGGSIYCASYIRC